MNLLIYSLIIIIAPLTYCLAGFAVWKLFRISETRFQGVPLLGCAVLAWVAELGFVLGLRTDIGLAVILVLSLGVLVLNKREKDIFFSLLKELYQYYAILIVAVLVNPYPGLGHMSGDWLEHFLMSQGLFSGVFPEKLLARPPLFSAGADTLYLFKNSLSVFQIYSAVASAAALLAFNYGRDVLGLKRLSRGWLFLFLLMAHFLVHTVTLWPKMLVAGMLLCSAVEALRYRHIKEGPALIWSGIWFGFAIAGHHTSLLYAPLLALIAFYRSQCSLGQIAKNLFVLTSICFVLAGLFECWTIWKFGIEARIAHNPSMMPRPPGLAFPVNIMISNFAGRDPWSAIMFKLGNISGSGIMSSIARGYYLFSCWMCWMTCTFLGLLLPILIVEGRKFFAFLAVTYRKELFWPAVIGSLAVIVGAGLTQPHIMPFGSTQCGLNGINFFLLFFVAGYLADKISSTSLYRINRVNFLIGTFPFFLSEFLVLVALRLPGPLSEKAKIMLMQSDVDANLVFQGGYVSLGWETYPYGIPILLAVVGILILSLRKVAGTAGTMPQT